MRELIIAGMDPDAAADAYIARHPDEAAVCAKPYYLSMANRLRASERRRAEQRTRAQINVGVPMAQARRELAETHFLVPGHGYVAWNEATVEQHRLRIDALRGHVDAVEKTIALHQAAIEQIEAAGATCLDDLS